jgi:hypothetical protein
VSGRGWLASADGHRGAVMDLTGRLLLIVARETPARLTYFQHSFGSDSVEVIVDRRVGQRRRRDVLVAKESRRHERRRRDVTEELQRVGWTLVRH